MDDPRAQRTLVKSPPELWAEISDVGALAGHLGAFGEIRITRLEHESTVAWEGDRARGTVELEPSGWGTKVTLTAQIAPEPPRDPEPAAPPEPEGAQEPAAEGEVEREEARADEAPAEEKPAPDPVAEAAPAPDDEPARRRGLFARLFGRRRDAPVARDEPVERVAGVEPVAAPTHRAAEGDEATAREPARTPGPVGTPGPARDIAPVTDDAPNTPTPVPLDAGRAEAILVGVLDDLGAARHRPFSRG